MLLPIKLICPKNKVRKDGTCIIFIQYCGTGDKKTLLNTEIAIPPKYWNRKYLRIAPDLPEVFGLTADINQRLADLLRKASDIISHAVKKKIQDVPAFVKKTFHPDFDVTTLELKAQQARRRAAEAQIVAEKKWVKEMQVKAEVDIRVEQQRL